jgi:TonB dependent receptor
MRYIRLCVFRFVEDVPAEYVMNNAELHPSQRRLRLTRQADGPQTARHCPSRCYRFVVFEADSPRESCRGHQGGDGMADLLMGLPNDIKVRYTISGGTPTSPDYNIIFPSWGFYVNDKFRLSPKLTLSVGLRYELSIPDYTPDPKAAPCCAIYTATADGGVLKYPGIAPGLSNHYLSVPKEDFAPRVSAAYSFTPQRVIRAGYGIFYDTDRVFFAGFSSGSGMVQLFASRHPELVDGVVAVATPLMEPPKKLTRPVPILYIHGDEDEQLTAFETNSPHFATTPHGNWVTWGYLDGCRKQTAEKTE